MGDQRISASEFRAKIDSGEFQIGKKGRIVATKASVSPAPKVSDDSQKKHKYGAKEVLDEVTGKKSSTLEDKHAKEYRMMLKQGLILAYAQQVEIGLISPRTGGYHKYVCDHLLIHHDGKQEYIDSKGVETPEFKKKANWMERQFLVDNPLATFSARFANRTHHYEAKPGKKKGSKSPRCQ